MKTQVDAAEVIRRIREMAKSEFMEVRSYSGRGMGGKECIAVDCDDRDDMVEACVEYEIPRPTFDSMGLGMIAYWPNIEFFGDDE